MALAFALVVAIVPVTARADDTAVAANQFLVTQVLDGITTRELITDPCKCTFERDPLARPASRSNLGMALSIAVVNVGARLLFRHSPALLRVFAGVEGVAVVNNVRVLIK